MAVDELEAHERLHERDERSRVVERRLGVHDPHLDRPETRLRAHVPPEVRVVGERPAVQQEVDRAHVLAVGPERARDPDARERLKQRRARRREAGVAPLPERRVGRQREQDRHVRAQAVERGDARLARRQADVHVQRERRLAAGQLAHRAVDLLVALARRHRHLMPDGRGVRAGRRRRQAERLEHSAQPPAQAAKLGDGVADVRVHARAQLRGRRVRLGADVVAHVLGQRREDLVDARCQRPVARVEEHDLLLDAERVLVAVTPFRPRRRLLRPRAVRRHVPPPSRRPSPSRRTCAAGEPARAIDHALGMPLDREREAAIHGLDRLDHPVCRPADGPQAVTENVDRLVMKRVHADVGAAERRRDEAVALERDVVRRHARGAQLAVHDVRRALARQVLHERAPARDVEHLQPAADGEHRQVTRLGGAHERDLEAVEVRLGRAERGMGTRPVHRGVQVRPA